MVPYLPRHAAACRTWTTAHGKDAVPWLCHGKPMEANANKFIMFPLLWNLSKKLDKFTNLSKNFDMFRE